MRCPRCFGSNISLVNGTHYVCNNESCTDDNGKRTQFSVVSDTEIKFPYNQIFRNRLKTEFYKVPYLQIGSVGNVVT